jgi:zinc transport system ATP-binding protein
MTAVVEVCNLTVPGRVADVTFRVEPGALHALVGPNGSGKSSVLDALLGLVPFTGTVRVSARKLAMVPQRLEVPVALPMTVLEFLAAQRTARPVVLGVSAALRGRLVSALEAMGLAPAADRPLSALSGGELRRVLIANALADSPDLVLLDEPEAGLDAASQAALGEALAGLGARGVAALWVTHDAPRVQALATHVTRLGECTKPPAPSGERAGERL